MNRVFTGYLWEQFLWFIVLLASLIFVSYATYGFLKEYWSFKIYTDMQVKTSTDIAFPALTICLTVDNLPDRLAGYMACYGTLNIYYGNHYRRPCRSKKNIWLQKILNSSKYALVHPTFPDSCIIINPYGNLTNKNLLKPLYSLPVDKSLSLTLAAYVHDHNDIGFSLHDRPQLFMRPSSDVTMNFRNKLIISRLPAPYTSRCKNDSDKSIFPGPYSVRKCSDTCLFDIMISKCGDVIDQWQIYLTEKKPVNKTNDEVRNCLRSTLSNKLACDCPASCKELLIEVRFVPPYNPYRSKLRFEYQSSTYTEITEVPAYPANKFITDIGGWLSLFTGMSVLSLLEILLFILLTITVICRRLNLLRKKDK